MFYGCSSFNETFVAGWPLSPRFLLADPVDVFDDDADDMSSSLTNTDDEISSQYDFDYFDFE
jgi:hypothetical protein